MALVVQGGGMRGTYSIAALAELEAHGLTNRFESIYGTSAGALNAGYFMAGQAAEGVSIYVEWLSNKRFIDLKRIRKIIDIDFLIDEVLTRDVPLNVDRVLASQTRLTIGLTDVSTAATVWATNDGTWPILEAFRATAALPIVYGREVVIAGRAYVDGGVCASVPLLKAIDDGHTDILVILTRSKEFIPESPSGFQATLIRIAARLKGHSREVVHSLGRRDDDLVQVMQLVRAGGDSGVRIWAIAPSVPIAGRLTNDRALLLDTASCAKHDTLTLIAT
jgi:predicted patatin/cPLA2 family phospholipase